MYTAHCVLCKSNFSIANDSTYDINRHAQRESHQKLVHSDALTKSEMIYPINRANRLFLIAGCALLEYLPQPSDLQRTTAAEVTLVFHSVTHGHSHRSQTCTFDVIKSIWN